MKIKNFTDLLKPLRRKLIIEQTLNYAILCLIFAIAVDILILVVSKFIYIDSVFILTAAVIGISCAVGIAASLMKRPSDYAVASAFDGLGFKERFITALEILKKREASEAELLAVDDAVETARNTDIKRLYGVSVPKNKRYILACMVAALFLAGFVEGPTSGEAAQRERVKAKISDEIKSIEKDQQELSKKVTHHEAKKIDAKVKELIKQLKNSKTEADAVRALQKTAEQMKKISNDSVAKDLKTISETLSGNKNTMHLARSLQNGSTAQIKDNMEKLKEFLERADDEERQRIAKDMAEAISDVAGNPDLTKALEQYVNAVQNGHLGDNSEINAASEELARQLEALASENEGLRDAINELEKTLAQSSESLQGEGQKSGQGQNPGEGQNPGGGQTPGQGQNPGQGQGGAGQGQGNQPGGSGRGRGHIENENIYSRDAEGYGDYEANVQGTDNEGGQITEQERRGLGQTGGSVPYEQVVGSYRDEALSSLEDYDIPSGMRNLVMEYFSTLE